MKRRSGIKPGIILLISILGLVLFYYPFPDDDHEDEPAGIEVDKTRYPITGIDVSRHTGKVDFKIIKERFIDTLDFVYLKATEGVDLVDSKFEANYLNARENEIPVGSYHFFKFNVSGKKQANNYLRTIRDKTFELPLVLDVEEWSNASVNRQDKVVKEIRAFITEIVFRRKEKLMIYTNESGFQKYILGNFESNEIWICSFNAEPKIQSNWILWQHSHKGKLDGAEGWVDINTFNGTRKEWNQFLEF
jgi:lysozyme